MTDESYFSEDLRKVFSELASSPVLSELAFRLRRCHQTTLELRKLCPNVLAVAEGHDQVDMQSIADTSAAARRLDPERRDEIRSALQALNDELQGDLDSTPIDEEALNNITEIDALTDPFKTFANLMPIGDLIGPFANRLVNVKLATTDEVRYFLALVDDGGRPQFLPLVSSALFARIIGQIEPTLNRLLKLSLRHQYPDKYASLADSRLDDVVRKDIWGGPKEWRKTIERGPNGTVLAGALRWDELRIAWSKRNVITHHNGVVDEGYRRLNADSPSIGMPLLIEPEDLQDAIDLVGATRMALVIGMWEEHEPGRSAEIGDDLWFYIWDEIRHGHWQLAEQLARVSEAFSTTDEGRAVALVNRWLAIEKGCGPEAISGEVSAWSTEGLPAVFNLAKMILLRQDASALRAIEVLRKSGELSESQIGGPLFDRLRIEGSLTS